MNSSRGGKTVTNTEILADPDVVRALQCWWDETHSFAVGVSSAVVADLLEEKGWDTSVDGWAETLTKMRGDLVVRWFESDAFEHAAGVFRVSAGTVANPVVARMFQWLRDIAREEGVSYYDLAKAHVLVSAEDAGRMGMSREVREYLMQARGDRVVGAVEKNPLALCGLPVKIMFGMAVLLNESQTPGQVDLVAGETIITARVY